MGKLNALEVVSDIAPRIPTGKPVFGTHASHLNYVAADTQSWEQAAALQLEMAAMQGLI